MVIYYVPVSAHKTYREQVCVFLFRKVSVSTELMFRITVKNTIWKLVLFN
jgi:hypothetical protein